MSMRRGGTKHLNENLAPLQRFLKCRVGQPWNAVYSEICANLRPTSAVQKHVLDHLWQMVYIHVVKVDGKLFGHDRYGVKELASYWWTKFYVCPDTGRLCVLPRQPRHPKKPANPDVVVLADDSQLRRLGGIWYIITLAPVPATGQALMAARDVVLGRVLSSFGDARQRSHTLRELYNRHDRYAVAKRQLGKRDLRRYAQVLPTQQGVTP